MLSHPVYSYSTFTSGLPGSDIHVDVWTVGSRALISFLSADPIGPHFLLSYEAQMICPPELYSG